jgi:putative ribosome biogenesis GTPase RsgA
METSKPTLLIKQPSASIGINNTLLVKPPTMVLTRKINDVNGGNSCVENDNNLSSSSSTSSTSRGNNSNNLNKNSTNNNNIRNGRSMNDRNGEKIIMLQRPTPVLLTKQQITESPKITIKVSFLFYLKKLKCSIKNSILFKKKSLSNDNGVIVKNNENTKPQVILMGSGSTKVLSKKEITNETRNVTITPPTINNDPNDHLKKSLKGANTNIMVNKQSINNQSIDNVQQNKDAMEPISVRLGPLAPIQRNAIRLIDDNFTWNDQFMEFLIDQPDYLVVGILGKMGVGKSTIMSSLAGDKINNNEISEDKKLERTIFRRLAFNMIESGQHKTNGVQAFVTCERTIFLDVQV